MGKTPPPCPTLPLPHEGCLQRGLQDRELLPVLSGSHLQDRWGWAPLPRQRQILGVRRSPGGPDLALSSYPSSLVLFPPYSLAWVFTLNSPLQLCAGTGRLLWPPGTPTKGVAWIREEAPTKPPLNVLSPQYWPV